MSTFKYTRGYFKETRRAILCESEQEAKEIHGTFGGRLDYDKDSRKYFYWHNNEFSFYSTICENPIPASEVITAYEASKKPERKIVGYIAPFDMYHGNIEFGDILVKAKTSDDLWGVMVVGEEDFEYYPLPDKIVESWEPVYEEVKPLFGSFSDIIKHFEGCKVVAEKWYYILVSNQSQLKPAGELVHHHLSIETGWRFSEQFQAELKELGIKI